ncbi:zinc finger, CCHC-type containing protein [Tanacetum coccineum]|uniref:Zinc finger, CCHC-type containing protein n=1 Tax=Tanacetum coccineum TaxID=301880 RepID=A0ABQ5J818_9ASTR
MGVAAMKHMASNFAKLDKFERVDFRRWQKKIHFLLSNMSVVYVLTTPIHEDGENATMDQIRKRAKWENDDYVCRGLILSGISDHLFDIYQNVESSKELWDTLEAKYMAEDASSKKLTQHKMNMDEAIQVSFIIDKLHSSWKDCKHNLKHKKEELTFVELGSHLRIEESFRVQDNDKPKSNNVVGPSVFNMVEHNNSSGYNDNKGKRKHHDNTMANPNKKVKPTCWKCGKTGHIKRDFKGVNIGNKANGSGTKGSLDGSNNSMKDDDVAWWVDLRETMHVCKDRCWFKTYESLNDRSILHMGNESTTLVHGRGCADLRFSYRKIVSLFNVLHGCCKTPDPKLKTLDERGIECIFVRYVKHSKAFRFYVIGPNESVLINSIIKSRDAIFEENRFSLVPRPSLRISNGTEYIGGSVVPKRSLKRTTQSSIRRIQNASYAVSKKIYSKNILEDDKRGPYSKETPILCINLNGYGETDNPSTTMEEYVLFETEKALRNCKVYNLETAKYGMVNWYLDEVDIDILRFLSQNSQL